MLNITLELVLLTISGVLLAAGSSASQASNVYRAAAGQADEAQTVVQQLRYWACPAEYRVCPTEVLPVSAKADDSATRVDATMWDAPEASASSFGSETTHYDYGPVFLGD